MFMMDEAQRATSQMQLTDAYGRPAGQAPGYVFSAAQVTDARDAAYADYEQRVSEAWRGQQPTKQAAHRIATDTRADAYADYEASLTNAWRAA